MTEYKQDSVLLSPDLPVCTLTNDAELFHPPFVRAIRQAAYEENVDASKWLEHLYTLYRDIDVQIVGPDNQPVSLDLSIFEASDHDFDSGTYRTVYERQRNWFRSNCCEYVLPDARVHVKEEGRERFRVLATLLCAAYPERAKNWFRLRPANDNYPSG